MSPAPEYQGTDDTPAVARAVASLIDIVEMLCRGLAAGETPGEEWATMVSDNLAEHRRELGVVEPR